ncbi:MAG TPA: UDP binding domain-containing protein, partial [Rhizomicrobium sp.]|nr:UDP binding domain-containing protein [Rhizomicrobium sp.]
GGVAPSNAAHRHWAFRRLEALLGGVKGRRIALLGLSYKPGTDAIRRSVAIEVCRLLVKAGAAVAAYDPTVKKLPDDLAGTVTLAPSAQDAIKNADAVVLATEWLEFCDPGIIQALKSAARPLLLDQSRFLIKNIPRDGSIEYVTVGGAA